MSTSAFAILLTVLCGYGDTDAHWECYDYYNNCVLSKSIKITEKNIKICKDAREAKK